MCGIGFRLLLIIISALLPVVVTLLLGYFAAWHQDFGAQEATTLNRLVINYALPLSLFTGTMATPRGDLVADVPLALAIAGSMLATYFVAVLVARYIARRDLATSALQALAIAMPAIPFVGATVLDDLVGPVATVPTTAGTLAMNLLLAPLALLLMGFGTAGRGARSSVWSIVLSTAGEPVVWAPLLAFALILWGLELPRIASQSLLMLGHGGAGVALFATGIVMFSRRVSLTPIVALNVLSRMIIAPGAVWALLSMSNLPLLALREMVIMTALPTAALSVILAVRFKTAEQEMSSTLFFANLCAPVTLGTFIWLTA